MEPSDSAIAERRKYKRLRIVAGAKVRTAEAENANNHLFGGGHQAVTRIGASFDSGEPANRQIIAIRGDAPQHKKLHVSAPK